MNIDVLQIILFRTLLDRLVHRKTFKEFWLFVTNVTASITNRLAILPAFFCSGAIVDETVEGPSSAESLDIRVAG
jgi:hypothetical protein